MSSIEDEIRRDHFLRLDFERLIRQRYGHNPHRSTAPHDIVKLLELDEIERQIDRRRARLFFDGKALEWIEDGTVRKRWPATSGKAGFNTKEHQHLKDAGPLPEGRYAVRQSEFQRWEEAGYLSRAACILKYINIHKAGTWPGCSIAWGTRRVWLRPYPANNMYGRNNFTIHGGWFPGSLGCIDLTDSMDDFVKEFLLYVKDMELEVRY